MGEATTSGIGRLSTDLPPVIRTDVPHTARMYDYFLGGKDNYPVDREAAQEMIAANPDVTIGPVENRRFMVRVARYLAEQGIRQFVDVGTGFPTSPNLHEVVQGVDPSARVLYIDNDPLVLLHARARLIGAERGRTTYLEADLRDPDLAARLVGGRDGIDPAKPTALLLIAVLHFLADDDDPYGIVYRLVDRLPAGSYLAVSHVTADVNPLMEDTARDYREKGMTAQTRDRAEVCRFFDSVELVEPGLAFVHRWRPDGPIERTDKQVSCYGAVGRKP
jgi:O-methyltransferase involved in polyketide biosynthesis